MRSARSRRRDAAKQSVAISKPRTEAGFSAIDVARKRRADVTGQSQRSARRTMLEHFASAHARLLRVGVLGKIPMRVIDLQQMVKHVTNERRVLAAAFEIEEEM